MVAIHIIAHTFPPVTEGGLEKRLFRLSKSFVDYGYKVFVHLCGPDTDPAAYRTATEAGIEIRLTATYRNNLDEAIRESAYDIIQSSMERYRMNTLILSSLIAQEVKEHGGYQHLLLSSYITTCGFMAMNVAAVLGLPHLAGIIGTDFSRGFFNPWERYLIDKVVQEADVVVSVNHSYLAYLKDTPSNGRQYAIHSSVSPAVKSRQWAPRAAPSSLVLFSDCGYSSKKGTEVLLQAFEKLVASSIEARLIVCGKIDPAEIPYWTKCREKYSRLLPGRIVFQDYLSEEQLIANLLDSDLYCHPTLAEGCSNSRIMALCIGVPMVTTASGEILDVASQVAHVRHCAPGNAQAFAELLQDTAVAYLNGELLTDAEAIQHFRSHFDRDRELRDWLAAIAITIEN